MVKNITKENFIYEVENSSKKILVDFWASWCGPCKMLSPIIDDVASKNEDNLLVLKVNVDEENELANEFGIHSIPTIILFENGKMVNKAVGYKTTKQLEEFLSL